MFITGNLLAMPVVQTLTGGGTSGHVDGDTASLALFHTPYALALDSSGGYLYVADRDNNAVRQLDLAGNQTYTFVPNAFVAASLISQPVGVALDSEGNVFVLNRGNGKNGTVLEFDTFGDFVATHATALTNAAGIALDGTGNIYLTVKSNTLLRISPGGATTSIATITNAGTSLQGLIVKHDGRIAACDAGRHGIYLIDPASGLVTTNAGFHGAGDFTSPNNVASSSTARFNQPYGVAEAGGGLLVVADHGNHRVKVVLPSGVVTNLYGVKSSLWYTGAGAYPGWWDGTVAVPDSLGGVEARQPVGVVFSSDGTVYTTETYYHLIRAVTSTGLPPPLPPPPVAPVILTVATNYGQVGLTWATVAGATNYLVKRSPASGGPYTVIATATAGSYTDLSVVNGTTYYYVVSAANAGGIGPVSNEVSATPPMPPVPDPQIGYVEFPPPNFSSVFHPVSAVVFNNDKPIVIIGAAGTQTFYEFANTLVAANVPNPTASSASAPVGYEDGLYSILGLTVAAVSPSLTIKAVGQQPGRPGSAVVAAQFQFIVGNPLVVGNNAAQFTVGDITDGAGLWFTTDGSDPTNAAPSQLAGTVRGTNVLTLSLPFPAGSTNLVFKVRGFKANYQPSGVVSNSFATANFNANKIAFGFDAGEASSDFVGSPGQLFYAPVTLAVLPGVKIFSLQFNVTATNLTAPPIPPGALGFESMLMKPIPNVTPVVFEVIPPAMFVTANVPNPIYLDGSTNFASLLFTNSAANLLGVGWLERAGHTNLYDTTKQDLITYSMAHDTMFASAAGKVVAGGFSFTIGSTAAPGQKYQLQIGRPSATADGVGAPGSDVYIATPTNGSLAGGAINSIKQVTVGQRKYIVGDAAPFRWFNAGDFGNSNLLSDDVMQVFQSAVYWLNSPPEGSDFQDAMDSCGGTYVDLGHGYLEFSSYISGPAAVNPLFDGNNTSINQIAFGDGQLDVCDVYVTFRRSLDPSLSWFRRFWTNGVRGAELVGNPPPAPSNSVAGAASAAVVNFASADSLAAAGQTLQIPITAQISGAYPLRTLMLNLSVNALEGAPALTSAVQFTPHPALGPPGLSDSKGNGNYAATWLNSTIPGLTGNVTLGTLTVQVPANAGSSAAYAVNFDHASASPNGLASFPKQTKTGLITRSDRSASSWNDGIPDSWRLRYFGSLNNVISQATADADGDGANNLQEFKAGTNPNDASSVLRLKSNVGPPRECIVRWPSVSGKQYIIERAASLYAPVWSAISTNSGTGLDLEFHESAVGSGSRFYRVRVLR